MFRIWNFVRDVKRLGPLLRIVERKRSCECWLDECWLSREGMQTHSIDSIRFMPCRSMPGFSWDVPLAGTCCKYFKCLLEGFHWLQTQGTRVWRSNCPGMCWQVTHINPFQKTISQRPQSIERSNNGRTMDFTVKIKSPFRCPSSYCKNCSSMLFPAFFAGNEFKKCQSTYTYSRLFKCDPGIVLVHRLSLSDWVEVSVTHFLQLLVLACLNMF